MRASPSGGPDSSGLARMVRVISADVPYVLFSGTFILLCPPWGPPALKLEQKFLLLSRSKKFKLFLLLDRFRHGSSGAPRAPRMGKPNRTRVVEGKSVAVREDLGGDR